MRYLFLLTSILVLTVSCKSKPTCDLTTKYANIAGNNIGAALKCSHPELIGQDIESEIAKLNLCTAPIVPVGAIASLLCPAAASVVTGLIVHSVIPSAWGCTGGVPAQGLTAFLTSACSALPF